VQGLDGLHLQGWYLLACNHLSAVDILVLQHVFHGRIPFLKFFLKRELIWVPLIGMAWWALDFPFMRRGKTREAQRQDLETARAACEKFRHQPTSVMNFVEGTRVSAEKIASERSPYKHLLKPKVGGLSVALATMGEQFEALLDVTLVYPDGVPSFWDLLCGRSADSGSGACLNLRSANSSESDRQLPTAAASSSTGEGPWPPPSGAGSSATSAATPLSKATRKR
jgi:1-acyl-sn-glycerol-3-phosphate acyltransferase